MASSGFIEVLKVDGVGCAAAARRLQFLSYMDACPVWNEKNAAHLARVHHVDGALTRERFAQVAGKVDAVVVEDLTKVFLDPGVLSSIPLWVRRRIPLKAVVINPWGMTRDQVQAFLERQAPQDRMMLTPFWEASG